MTRSVALGPWPAGMNLRVNDASLGAAARLLVNVDVDPAGLVAARPPKRQVLALAGAHSLTAFNDRIYGVQAGKVFSWVPGDSAVAERHVVGNARMRWSIFNGELYGASPRALVRFGANHTRLEWGQFDAFTDADGVQYAAPTPADNLAAFGAHLLLVRGNKLSWAPAFQPLVSAPYRDYVVLPETIRLVAPVDTGVWVASATHTWFLQGRVPGEWVARSVADFGALGGDYAARDNAAYWLTERGFVVGDAQGSLSALQDDAVAIRCAGEPALLRTPWRPELFIATLPDPTTTPATFAGLTDALILKGV